MKSKKTYKVNKGNKSFFVKNYTKLRNLHKISQIMIIHSL